MSLLLGMSVLHFLVGTTHQEVPNGIVIPVGRRLLLLAVSSSSTSIQYDFFHNCKLQQWLIHYNLLSQDDHADSSVSNGSGSGIGSFLGWAMAVIYMGGRLPQIWLNVILHKQPNVFFFLTILRLGEMCSWQFCVATGKKCILSFKSHIYSYIFFHSIVLMGEFWKLGKQKKNLYIE